MAARSTATGSAAAEAARAGPGAARDYDPKAVRVWAESQGIQVSQRGWPPAWTRCRLLAIESLDLPE
jgi:hypothetical protein